MDFELGIGPVSGWRSPGGRREVARRPWLPPWGMRRQGRIQGKSLGHPREHAAAGKRASASFLYRMASMPSFPPFPSHTPADTSRGIRKLCTGPSDQPEAQTRSTGTPRGLMAQGFPGMLTSDPQVFWGKRFTAPVLSSWPVKKSPPPRGRSRGVGGVTSQEASAHRLQRQPIWWASVPPALGADPLSLIQMAAVLRSQLSQVTEYA